MTDSQSRYTFACPNCSESLSILFERIPPVQARFNCPKCQKPMDFPSREEARAHVLTQAAGGAPGLPAPSAAPGSPLPPTLVPPAEVLYRVEKKGFENDSYDRRDLRNLIRSGGITESDPIRAGTAEPRRAGELKELKPLFELRKSLRFEPPTVCRTHTNLVAQYLCIGSGRPLCEECAQERKYGGATVRFCGHCGGTVQLFAEVS